MYLYVLYLVYSVTGVGGIEAEAVMLGQAISMLVPEVVGYKITGKLGPFITSTDVVLTITKVVRISILWSLLVSYFGLLKQCSIH